PLLDSELVDIMLATYDGTLAETEVRWKQESAACVVMASGGYPVKYESGKEISGLDAQGQTDGVFVYHAGTKFADGKFLTAGGRVLGVTATADTLEHALEKSYKAVEGISWEKVHYRHDIGKRALAAKQG
ncbi:MAG: phosphoribosylamine--glycine ligase, partial [Oscillospiraceae bacterium]|nr:phosphoribosylamine--glycine ligase [Oscillospiraceae bacterium]